MHAVASGLLGSTRNRPGYDAHTAGCRVQCPGACRKACVQATALYGAELWWDDREGAGVKNRRDEIQKLENQLGRAVTGNL